MQRLKAGKYLIVSGEDSPYDDDDGIEFDMGMPDDSGEEVKKYRRIC